MNRQGKNRWRRSFRLMVSLAAVPIVIGWMASNNGLKRELAAVRAKGLPTNPKELDAWYATPPEAENASLKFLKARESFVEPAKDGDPGDIDWREIPHTQGLDGKTMAILERYLSPNVEALRLMREAAKLRRSRYPVDLSKAPQISFMHLARLNRLAQLVRWEGIYLAEHGDATGTAETLKDAFALGHTLAQEPVVIAELVRSACIAIELAGLERVVNVARFDEKQLSELQATVHEASEDCQRSLYRALVGERAFMNTGQKLTFKEYEDLISLGGLSPQASEVPVIFRKLLYYGERAIGMHERDHAFYIRSVGRMADAAALNFPELLRESDAVIADIEKELARHPIAYRLSAVSLPMMFRVPGKEAFLCARLRCIETALVIERWRRKNRGRLPDEKEVSALIESAPRDPVDGARLEFHATGEDGYRVVAAGATAEEKKRGVSAKSPAIGFSIER